MHVTQPLYDPTVYAAAYNAANLHGKDHVDRTNIYQDHHHHINNSTTVSGRLRSFMDPLLQVFKFMLINSKQHEDTPNIIKLATCLGGIVICFMGMLTIINPFNLFSSPTYYLYSVYQALFGVVIILIETKDWDCLQTIRPLVFLWFRFLTIPVGKGMFYIFIGSLQIINWIFNLFHFFIGIYMISMGTICLALSVSTGINVQYDLPDFHHTDGQNVYSSVQPSPSYEQQQQDAQSSSSSGSDITEEHDSINYKPHKYHDTTTAATEGGPSFVAGFHKPL